MSDRAIDRTVRALRGHVEVCETCWTCSRPSVLDGEPFSPACEIGVDLASRLVALIGRGVRRPRASAQNTTGRK